MPPINQQGSRAGLVTGLVVFVVLFVISTVLAFQFFGKWKDSDASKGELQKQYKDFISANELQQPTVTELQQVRTDATNKFGVNSSDSVVDVAVKQRDALASAIMGTAGATPAGAVDSAGATIKEAQGALAAAGIKTPLPTSGLVSAIKALTKDVTDGQTRIESLTSEVRDRDSTVAATKAEEDQAKSKFDQDLKDQQAKAAADLANANQATDASKAVVTQMQADIAAAAKATADADAQKDAQIATLTQQLNKANGTIGSLEVRLANRRVDVSNAVVRQVDGKLIRVPSTDICYINLGTGDQVTPGLTFEVYDKTEGVPPIPSNATGDEQLPVGKASIEITHVGTTESECRIVHIEPGAVLSEGDPIENLVYDPHTKYNFFVYGNFDLANAGRPNAADTEVIKRLVTQWGGRLTDEINVDTDFVVMGSEPVLPTFAKVDLTAENQDKVDKAQKEIDKYQERLAQAKELHIPIMNQNRFLYYVGFYDQAKHKREYGITK